MTLISDKLDALRTAGSSPGTPLGPETATADGGQFQDYSNGWSIYYHPRVGAAFETHGAIRALWASLGRETSALGYPTSDELDSPHIGKVSHFEHGDIYWDGGRGAYEVWPPPPPMICAGRTQGQWRIPAHGSGVVGVHAALVSPTQVLFFTYRDPGEDAPSAPARYGDATVLDLTTGAITRSPIGDGEANLFCSGQAFLGDGRLLVGGGERENPINTRALHVFTPGPGGGSWARLPDLAAGRWYPTCATLPDGGVIIVGGQAWEAPGANHHNPTLEIFRRGTLGPRIPAPFLVEEAGFTTYPFVFTVPGNKVFIHIGTRSRLFDLATETFDAGVFPAAARPLRTGRTYGLEGTSVLLPLRPSAGYRARVMMFGGGGAPGANIRTPATSSCERIDLGAAAPAWQLTAPMPHPRVMPDAVLLPDGKVLVVNGSSTGHADHGANPVYAADLYDPDADSWTTLCNMQVPRLYHATALLLPDGRVMTAGSDSMWNPDPFHVAEDRVEIFSPPYLFGGPRPTINEAPTEIFNGQTFEVISPEADEIDQVVVMRCGSCTHSFNSDQRLIELEIEERVTRYRIRWVWRDAPIANRPIRVPEFVRVRGLRLRAPRSGDVAPPGNYMLFLLRDGVPSVARFVKLGALLRLRIPDVFPFPWPPRIIPPRFLELLGLSATAKE